MNKKKIDVVIGIKMPDIFKKNSENNSFIPRIPGNCKKMESIKIIIL